MFDDLLRALKDRWLAPVARRVSPRVSPLAITFLAFAAGLGATWTASRAMYGAALGLWWLNRALDGFDGTLARVRSRQTELGGYLDIVLDFVVYAAVPLGLVIAVPNASLAAVVLLASFYINAATWMYLSAILERRGAQAGLTAVSMPPGLIAGAETIVLYSLFFLMPDALVTLFWLMAALVLITALQRVVWVVRTLALLALVVGLARPARAQDTLRDTTHTIRRVDVNASSSRPLVNTTNGEVGGSVDRRDLLSIGTDAHDPLDAALTIPGVTRGVGFFDFAPKLAIDGANGLYTPYFVDGLENNENYLGGPKVLLPNDAIQRLDVQSAAYGVEYGKSANGVVDEITRRGGDAWAGNAYVDGRPGPSQFRRIQGGADGGGPLVAGRTYVFGAADYAAADSAVPYAFGDPRFGGGSGNSHRTLLRAFARVDQQWSATQGTTVDVGYSNIDLVGQGGGDVTREADQTQHRIGLMVGVRHTSIFAGWTNTAAAQVTTYHYFYPASTTSFSVPQVNLVASDANQATLATVGAPGFLFDEREFAIQLRNTLRRTIGSHDLRVGAEASRNQVTLKAVNTNPAGTYGVLDSGVTVRGPQVSINDVPTNARVLYYTIDAHSQDIQGMQVLAGAFAKDVWAITPRLTLDYGLRWDYDDLTAKGNGSAQLDNFQPRASVNWRVTNHDIVRGGAGIYVGRIPLTTYTDYRQFARNGDNVVTFVNPSFGLGQGPTATQVQAAVATEPAREIRELYAHGARDPRSYQAALGYERRLGSTWSLAVDGSVVGTMYLPRIYDLNAPPCVPTPGTPCTPDEMQRPDGALPGSYSFHTTTDFGGESIYWGVTTTVRHALTPNWIVDLSYTLSRIRDNTEDLNFAASYANDFHNEWADAVGDRRHHVQGRSVYRFLDRFEASTMVDFATGTPQNVIAPIGTDYTGSANYLLTANAFDYNFQRAPGTPRDSQRLPSEFNQSVGLKYETPFGVSLRADVFNVWNETLISGFVNNVPGGGPRTLVPGSQSDAAGLRRAFQFGAIYSF